VREGKGKVLRRLVGALAVVVVVGVCGRQGAPAYVRRKVRYDLACAGIIELITEGAVEL